MKFDFQDGPTCRRKTSQNGKIFWMVWSPTGNTPTRMRHLSRENAEVAAKEMAQTYRGQEFFVMQACSLSMVDGVKTTVLE